MHDSPKNELNAISRDQVFLFRSGTGAVHCCAQCWAAMLELAATANWRAAEPDEPDHVHTSDEPIGGPAAAMPAPAAGDWEFRLISTHDAMRLGAALANAHATLPAEDRLALTPEWCRAVSASVLRHAGEDGAVTVTVNRHGIAHERNAAAAELFSGESREIVKRFADFCRGGEFIFICPLGLSAGRRLRLHPQAVVREDALPDAHA